MHFLLERSLLVGAMLIRHSLVTTFYNEPLIGFLLPRLHFGEVSICEVFHSIHTKQILWANEGNYAHVDCPRQTDYVTL